MAAQQNGLDDEALAALKARFLAAVERGGPPVILPQGLPDVLGPVRWWRRRALHRKLQRGWWRMAVMNYRDSGCIGVIDDIDSALRELERSARR